MICACGAKMRCIYSVPTENRTRFRTYRCQACNSFEDTFEVPELSVVSKDLRQIMNQARHKQFAAVKRFAKKGQGG